MSKATELREEAAKLFSDAAELVKGKDADDLSSETSTKFYALIDAASAKDAEYTAAIGHEEKADTLRERLAFYSQKATGAPAAFVGGDPVPFGSRGQKSWGQAFVDSAEYKGLQDSGALKSDTQGFKTGGVEAGSFGVKAATDVIYSQAGGGGALVTPQYLPGVLPLPQRPLPIRDLFSNDTTQSDTLSYARQTSFDTAAAPVAQATSLATGLKPQSAIGWTRVTTPIESVATWMAATRRQLSDVGQTRSLIDNQLTLMLKLVEEDQLLNGNGTSPNLRGLLATAGVQTLSLTGVAAAPFINIDGIRDAIRLVRTGAAFAEPNGVVMNPIDAAKLDEAKDTQARYLGQGPFNPMQDSIWRLPRIESLAVAAGTAIVGAFREGATVFEREGVVILTADQHSDFFIRNLVAVLAEERIGLAVFFPAAFVNVTFKSTGWANA